MKKTHKTKGKMWKWQSPEALAVWYFVHVEKAVSERIKADSKGVKRGFGSVKVEVTLRKTVWQTSLFPSKRDGVYLLPIKASVRKDEDLYEGYEVKINIKLI